MSRYPSKKNETDSNEECVKIDDITVKTICSSITPPSLIETLPAFNINIVDATETPGQSLAQREVREVRRAQREDELIDRWRIAVIDKRVPTNVYGKEDLMMKKQYKNYKMKRGILFRTVKDEDREIDQLVLPSKYRKETLQGLHNDVGHPGKERTLKLLCERFYWPGMSIDVDK